MTYGNYNTFKSFATIDSSEHSQALVEKIKNEIESKGKEYILRVDEEEFKNYLIQKCTFDPLVIDYESESMDEPSVTKELIEDRMFGG